MARGRTFLEYGGIPLKMDFVRLGEDHAAIPRGDLGKNFKTVDRVHAPLQNAVDTRAVNCDWARGLVPDRAIRKRGHNPHKCCLTHTIYSPCQVAGNSWFPVSY